MAYAYCIAYNSIEFLRKISKKRTKDSFAENRFNQYNFDSRFKKKKKRGKRGEFSLGFKIIFAISQCENHAFSLFARKKWFLLL